MGKDTGDCASIMGGRGEVLSRVGCEGREERGEKGEGNVADDEDDIE